MRNIKKKLGKDQSGFLFPVKYEELEEKVLPDLTTKGRKFYEALLTKALTEESPVITLSLAEAEISDKTLAKCREELSGKRLVNVTRAASDKPYLYEILNPFSGAVLPRSVQRNRFGKMVLSKKYPRRIYSGAETVMVMDFFLGDRLHLDMNVYGDYEPRGDYSHRYICPFHIPDLDAPWHDKKELKAPLIVFADSGAWFCTHTGCRHYSKAQGRARAGDGRLVHFLRVYKWQFDQARTKTPTNLLEAQYREVIAQIIENDGFTGPGAVTLENLTYTTKDPVTGEFKQVPFDVVSPSLKLNDLPYRETNPKYAKDWDAPWRKHRPSFGDNPKWGKLARAFGEKKSTT